MELFGILLAYAGFIAFMIGVAAHPPTWLAILGAAAGLIGLAIIGWHQVR